MVRSDILLLTTTRSTAPRSLPLAPSAQFAVKTRLRVTMIISDANAPPEELKMPPVPAKDAPVRQVSCGCGHIRRETKLTRYAPMRSQFLTHLHRTRQQRGQVPLVHPLLLCLVNHLPLCLCSGPN